MRTAKIGARGGTFALAAFLAGFAIASCGGKIDSDSTFDGDDASSDDYPDVYNGFYVPDATFDAGSISAFGDGAAAYPPVDNGPQDTTPACAERPAFGCPCMGEDCPTSPDWYFGQLVRDCLGDGGSVCNTVYVDFDSNGCAIDLRALDPNDEFVKCATQALNANRWECENGGGQLATFVDCTSR